MRVGVASEWVGERVGGLDRQAADLFRNVVRVDPESEYRIFVTPRGAEALADVSSPRARLCPTAFNSRWYYVPLGLPLAALRHSVDLLHANFTVAPWCPARRLVLTVHDVCPDVHPDFFPPAIRRRFRYLVERGVRRAVRVVVPSEAARRELLEHYPVDAERVVVIPNGVRQGLSSAGAPSSPRDWPDEFVLYVGRFHARKNLRRLLAAFARVQAKRPALRLVLAGRDLWDRAEVMREVAALKLEEAVLTPGHVPDTELDRLYRKARVFAFPSIHEGFGIPPLEAMAYDLPVLASRSSAMPEILGDAAHYADPYDVEDLAHGLERLLDDESLRVELIARGRRRVRVYDWAEIARRTVALYRDVAEAN